MPLAPCSLLGIGKPPRPELGPILEPSLEALGRSQGWPRIASKLSRSPTSTRMHWRNRSCRIKLKFKGNIPKKIFHPTLHGSDMRWRNLSSAPQICSSDSKGMSPHTCKDKSFNWRRTQFSKENTAPFQITPSLFGSPPQREFSPCQREGCRGTRRWRPHHRNDPPGSIQVASKLVCLEKKFFVCFLPGKNFFSSVFFAWKKVFSVFFAWKNVFFLCFLPGNIK